MRQVYLDHQAATPLLPEVFEAMRPFFTDAYGNASSLHQHGLRVRDALARAREQVAAFVNASSPEEILFTSDGTESANLAVKGVAWSAQRRGRHLVASAIEHPAVQGSLEFLEKEGYTCTRVGVDAEGLIAPAHIAAALTDQTVLVAAHHVNHDLGTVQPIAEIARIAGERGLTCFVDAESSAGWNPIDVQALGADLLSFSPQRFYGPKGVGVLYRHRRARLTSLIHGGVQEGGRRAGPENVPAIIGAGVAAEIAGRELGGRAQHAARCQQQLWEGLRARIPHLKLNGPPPGPGRSPAQLNFSVEFVEGEGIVLMLDTRGIAIASGTSCVSKALKVSPVLTAIGLDHSLGVSAVSLTVGAETTGADIEYVLDTFPAVVAKLRSLSPLWDEFEHGKIDSLINPRGVAVARNQPSRRG